MRLITMATLLVTSVAAAGEPRLVIELAPTTSKRALELTVRARGSSDAYFMADAIRLEMRSADGGSLNYPYGCADKRGPAVDPVRLRPGQMISKTIDMRCYHPVAGVRYAVTAVFEDRGDDFRGEPPAGAVWVTGPIRSNQTFFEEPRNKVLLADGHFASSRDVERLLEAPAFSTIVGVSGCLTEEGASFVRVYGARDPKPFLELAGGAPAAKLYALCGLQHLNSPQASDLRKELSNSMAKTRLLRGCVLPPLTEVRQFFRLPAPGSPSAFDGACEILTHLDPAKLRARTCSRGPA